MGCLNFHQDYITILVLGWNPLAIAIHMLWVTEEAYCILNTLLRDIICSRADLHRPTPTQTLKTSEGTKEQSAALQCSAVQPLLKWDAQQQLKYIHCWHKSPQKLLWETRLSRSVLCHAMSSLHLYVKARIADTVRGWVPIHECRSCFDAL